MAIVEKFFDNPDFAVIAYGGKFPDGLCGGPFAMAMDAPLILVSASKQAGAVEYIESNSIKAGAVLGGSGVVGDEVAMNLFDTNSIDVESVNK